MTVFKIQKFAHETAGNFVNVNVMLHVIILNKF